MSFSSISTTTAIGSHNTYFDISLCITTYINSNAYNTPIADLNSTFPTWPQIYIDLATTIITTGQYAKLHADILWGPFTTTSVQPFYTTFYNKHPQLAFLLYAIYVIERQQITVVGSTDYNNYLSDATILSKKYPPNFNLTLYRRFVNAIVGKTRYT